MATTRHAPPRGAGWRRVTFGALLTLLVTLGLAAPAAPAFAAHHGSPTATGSVDRAAVHPVHRVHPVHPAAGGPSRDGAGRHPGASRTGPDPVTLDSAGRVGATEPNGSAATPTTDVAVTGEPLRHSSRAPPVPVVL